MIAAHPLRIPIMRIAALLLGLLFTGNATALDTFHELRTCVQGNIPVKTVRQDMAMAHKNRVGKERRLIGKMYLRRNDKQLLDTVMQLEQPKELFRAAYLLLEGSGRLQDKLFGTAEDRIYVYLPAARKPREVSASSAGSQLFGTNLNTQDIKHIFGALSGGKPKKLPDEKVNGRRSYPVQIVPYEQTSPYSKIMAYVDAQTCLTSKADFYGRSGKLDKTLSQNMGKVSREDGRFVGHEFKMQEAGSPEQTMLYFGNVQYDEGLSEALFHPDGFYKEKK